MIDTLAGGVALIQSLIPDVEVQGDDIDDTRPVIMVRQPTAPTNADLPLVASRLDVSCFAAPSEHTEDDARDLASRVFDVLHRRGVTFVTVGAQRYRLYRALHTDGGQLVRDPDSQETYTVDFYELKWSTATA